MAIANQAPAIVYLTDDGVLLCAARCADRENAALVGQRGVDFRAFMDDACEGCGRSVTELAARSTPKVRQIARDTERTRLRHFPVQRRTAEGRLLDVLRGKQRLIERLLAAAPPVGWYVEDLSGPFLSYAEVKAAASGPLSTPLNQ